MEIIDQEDAISCEIDPDQEQSGGNQSAARSYECTFCKRGFTNAQALGGHMNMHRKEKAKIKKSSVPSFSSNKVVVDTLKMIIPTPTRVSLAISTATAKNHGQSGSREETLIIREEVQQLQLFVEKPLNTNQNQKLEIHQELSTEVVSNQKIGSSLQHSSIVSELDLELRLGFEPRNSTSSSCPTDSTRHFF